jgi:hypothetical protein
VLDFTAGELLLQEATYPDGLLDDVTISSRNQIISSTGDVNMRLKISPKNGMIKGSIADPTTNRKIPVNAVVLQGQSHAAGFFLDGNESGLVVLGPESGDE